MAIGACMSCCGARVGGSTTSASTGCIAKRACRCASASASASAGERSPCRTPEAPTSAGPWTSGRSPGQRRRVRCLNHRRRLHTRVPGHRGRYLHHGLDGSARELDRRRVGAAWRPHHVDNGLSSTGQVLDEWAYRQGVRLRFIRPGKPVENAYIESFNGKFRDECLNEHWFTTSPRLAWSSRLGGSNTTAAGPIGRSACHAPRIRISTRACPW